MTQSSSTAHLSRAIATMVNVDTKTLPQKKKKLFFFKTDPNLMMMVVVVVWERRKRTNIMMVWIINFICEDNASDENLTEVKRGRILQSFSWFASHGQYVH